MIQAIRENIKYIAIVLIIILGAITFIQYENVKSLKSELLVSKNNEKAYIAENTELKENNIVFKFTVDQLNYLNDSLTLKINEVRKELNIKDKNLKQMQYLLSIAQKTDTVRLRDTIFIDNTINIDTLIGDDWYNIRLGLKYPNLITTTPTFKSEKYIVTSSKRETIDPPKNCAIARLFQKKHTIVEVEVIERNPYIENKQQRFIEIID
jgi:hypothetical protein